MKKLTIKIIAITIILLSFTGCEKDARDKYIGDWDFVVWRFFWLNDSGTYVNDTIYYLGKIKLSGYQNQLSIKFTEEDSVLCDISDSGKISKHYQDWHYYTRGQFEENDKAYIEHGYRVLGRGSEFTINGTKKKRE